MTRPLPASQCQSKLSEPEENARARGNPIASGEASRRRTFVAAEAATYKALARIRSHGHGRNDSTLDIADGDGTSRRSCREKTGGAHSSRQLRFTAPLAAAQPARRDAAPGILTRLRQAAAVFRRSGLVARHAFFLFLLVWVTPITARAQEKPILQIERDCQVFAISSNNKIVCAVPQLKRVKKDIIQRADIYVASPNGKDRQIIEGEKFMPVPPPQSFVVQSLSWSPDGTRLAMSMTTEKVATDYEQSSGGRAFALLEEDGREIKVPGLKTRFVEEAGNATWLTDNSTVVYLIGVGPFKIGRVSTVTGQSSTLFGDHTFDAVVWDAAHNQAYALSQNLNVQNRLAIFQLDLLKEGIREVSRIDAYGSGLSLSPSGKKIAFFSDGDAIEVIDIANPGKPVKVRAGMGSFAWSRDERRVLLKRGPPEKSGELIWVGLYEDSFVPALHGLEYHSFAITPDGGSIVVTEPGRGILRMFSIQ